MYLSNRRDAGPIDTDTQAMLIGLSTKEWQQIRHCQVNNVSFATALSAFARARTLGLRINEESVEKWLSTVDDSARKDEEIICQWLRVSPGVLRHARAVRITTISPIKAIYILNGLELLGETGLEAKFTQWEEFLATRTDKFPVSLTPKELRLMATREKPRAASETPMAKSMLKVASEKKAPKAQSGKSPAAKDEPPQGVLKLPALMFGSPELNAHSIRQKYPHADWSALARMLGAYSFQEQYIQSRETLRATAQTLFEQMKPKAADIENVVISLEDHTRQLSDDRDRCTPQEFGVLLTRTGSLSKRKAIRMTSSLLAIGFPEDICQMLDTYWREMGADAGLDDRARRLRKIDQRQGLGR